jgi:hypothetical protein
MKTHSLCYAHPARVMLVLATWLGLLLSTSLQSPTMAADPANRFWYTVTISRVTTTTTFTGSSDLGPEQFATRVAGETPVLLENLRVEALVPGDDGVKWHAVTENPNVYLMPRAVLFFQELRMDPLIERRQTQTTFRSVR